MWLFGIFIICCLKFFYKIDIYYIGYFVDSNRFIVLPTIYMLCLALHYSSCSFSLSQYLVRQIFSNQHGSTRVCFDFVAREKEDKKIQRRRRKKKQRRKKIGCLYMNRNVREKKIERMVIVQGKPQDTGKEHLRTVEDASFPSFSLFVLFPDSPFPFPSSSFIYLTQ